MRSRRYSTSLAESHHAVGSNSETGNLLPRRMGSAIATSPPSPVAAICDVGLASTHCFPAYRPVGPFVKTPPDLRKNEQSRRADRVRQGAGVAAAARA